jgi:hypothetical protein
MGHGVWKRLKRGCYRFVLRHAYPDLLEEEFSRRAIRSVSRELGSFLDGRAFSGLTVTGLPSESGVILGEVVHILKSVAKPADTILLPGERWPARAAYSRITGIAEDRILTAGIHEDMDFAWNYEVAPPAEIPRVEIVASQAMLEHLVDPYRHVRDCYSLLKPGGHLIFHTVMPGFKYHRFPVDCVRFHPDWFEVAAERLGAEVALRSVSTEAHIVYCLRKP